MLTSLVSLRDRILDSQSMKCSMNFDCFPGTTNVAAIRSDLCIADVFGAGKTRSLAVLLIALSCELDDFYAVVYTKENVAAKALADRSATFPHHRNQPLDGCWVVLRKERAKRMQRKLMCDAAIATESLQRSIF